MEINEEGQVPCFGCGTPINQDWYGHPHHPAFEAEVDDQLVWFHNSDCQEIFLTEDEE